MPDLSVVQERFSGILLAHWEELLRLRRVVLKTSDLDDIHDLRVASRRFRAVLDLYCRLSSKSPKSGVNKSVRKLTRTLGGLRNVDESRIFFQDRTDTDTFADSVLAGPCRDCVPEKLRGLARCSSPSNIASLTA